MRVLSGGEEDAVDQVLLLGLGDVPSDDSARGKDEDVSDAVDIVFGGVELPREMDWNLHMDELWVESSVERVYAETLLFQKTAGLGDVVLLGGAVCGDLVGCGVGVDEASFAASFDETMSGVLRFCSDPAE